MTWMGYRNSDGVVDVRPQRERFPRPKRKARFDRQWFRRLDETIDRARDSLFFHDTRSMDPAVFGRGWRASEVNPAALVAFLLAFLGADREAEAVLRVAEGSYSGDGLNYEGQPHNCENAWWSAVRDCVEAIHEAIAEKDFYLPRKPEELKSWDTAKLGLGDGNGTGQGFLDQIFRRLGLSTRSRGYIKRTETPDYVRERPANPKKRKS